MQASSDQAVEIVEVGPRDGLQNEVARFSTGEKLAFIRRLSNAGIRRIEVASFVHPKRVPAMADAEALLAGLPDREDVSYIGMTLNRRGAERALSTKVHELACVVVASDTFGIKNQGQNIQQAIASVAEIARLGRASGVKVQVTISAAFGCPFEGEVPMKRILEIAQRVADHDPCDISLADTIGVGVPAQVGELFAMIKDKIPHVPLRGHFHNTRNTGIANAVAALENGAVALDASLGGIGGCPFAPSATGNIATEDLVYLLNRSGMDSGVSLAKLIACARWMEKRLGRSVPSMLSRAGDFPLPQLA